MMTIGSYGQMVQNKWISGPKVYKAVLSFQGEEWTVKLQLLDCKMKQSKSINTVIILIQSSWYST